MSVHSHELPSGRLRVSVPSYFPMTEITSRLSTALADRYKIEREIGAGGMATVYLAEGLKHKRKVAVKVLRPELAAVGLSRLSRSLKKRGLASSTSSALVQSPS